MKFIPAICTTTVLAVAAGWLGGCQPVASSAPASQLPVQAQWHSQQLDCQQPLFINQQQWQLQNLRFYLSDFSLNQQPLLLASSTWQQPRLALLGTDCQGNSNWQLAFSQPVTAGKLSFTLGLPFALNHQNPLSANTPLNHSELFWSWQLGYKFLRLDMQGPDHGWAFHLGSTGCQSASVLRPPTSPCQAANTVVITLDYLPGQQLTLDLAALLNEVEINRHSSCMSDRQQQSCQRLLHNVNQPQLWSVLP
ncbi:MbnP family copper-binding protein [Arsukibacterium ikkense]|uniref:MbnP family copper-binding protein n=1 Tax=Arsukibacterium ikkense TaxID=336831 RepID=UPI000699AADC|nr:MbnP family copper-binding protein [Arsukibacterium ikkense]